MKKLHICEVGGAQSPIFVGKNKLFWGVEGHFILPFSEGIDI